MNTPNHNVLFSAEGFSARPELLDHAEEKAGKLVHHHSMQGHRLVRLHVKHEKPHSSAPQFSVCATVLQHGRDHVAHATAAEPSTAINEAFEKLDRTLVASVRLWKHRRHLVDDALVP
jgi:ribosome-associated translation inhibitor RaiA